MRNTLIILLLLGTGCVSAENLEARRYSRAVPTYDGPRRQWNETAVLVELSPGTRTYGSVRGMIKLRDVDGTNPRNFFSAWRPLEVLPGPHTVTIKWSREAGVQRSGEVSRQFHAEAGRLYTFTVTDLGTIPPRIEFRSRPRPPVPE